MTRQQPLPIFRPAAGPLGATSADGFQRAAQQQREATRRCLAERRTPAAALELFADTQARLIEGVRESPHVLRRDCRAGCSACCCVPRVDVTPLEALAVAEHLRGSNDDLSALEDRLADQVARRKTPAAKKQLRANEPCVLLTDESRCAAYAARPLTCVGTFSLSRRACETAVVQPASNNAKIPLDRTAKSWTMGTSMGLQRELAALGLDANLYELDSALLVALRQPDALQRWLRGKDVFKHAICNDAHSPPRKKRRSHRVDRPHVVLPARPAPSPVSDFVF